MPTTKIIDISYCQAVDVIDWKVLKKNGTCVMIRAGQYNYEDNLFRQHYANALANGVPCGLYWFYQPEQRPEYQVEAFMNVWRSLEVKPHVVALDVENIAYHDNETNTNVNVVPTSKEAHTVFIKYWLEKVEAAIGFPPMVYTRKFYWEDWVKRSLEVWPDGSKAWSHWPLWIASWTNYSEFIYMPADWAADTWKIWQYQGGTTGIAGTTGQIDPDEFAGSQNDAILYFGGEPMKEEQPMTSMIYDGTSQDERATIMMLSDDQPRSNIVEIAKHTDILMVRLGGMDGPENNYANMLYQDSGWEVRYKQAQSAGIPCLAYFNIAANYYLTHDVTKAMIERQGRENLPLRKLLNGLRTEPMGLTSELKADDGKWKNVPALALVMYQTVAFNGMISDIWQRITLESIVKNILFLQDNGNMPKIKLMIMASPQFFKTYPQKDTSELANCMYGYRDRVDFAMFDPLQEYSYVPGPHVDNCGVIWKTWRPDNTYRFPKPDKVESGWLPWGYGNEPGDGKVVMHVYTRGKYHCPEVFDSNGVQVPIDGALAYTNREKLFSYLGVPYTPGPIVVIPPEEPPTGGETIASLKAEIVLLNSASAARKIEIQEWLSEFPV